MIGDGPGLPGTGRTMAENDDLLAAERARLRDLVTGIAPKSYADDPGFSVAISRVLAVLREPEATDRIRPELPAGWYHRHGTDEETGRRFTYCEARGPVRAHCVRPKHGEDQGGHQWAWFTLEDRTEAESAYVANDGQPAVTDPTYGRIDADLQRTAEKLAPRSLGERVAIENTLQARRQAESVAAPSVGTGTTLPEALGLTEAQEADRRSKLRSGLDAISRAERAPSVGTGTPAEAVSGGSGHAERQGDAGWDGPPDDFQRGPLGGRVDHEVQEAYTAGLEQCQRRAVAAETEVERLTAEVARYRVAIEKVRVGIGPLRQHAQLVRSNPAERTYADGVNAACDLVEADLAAALGDGE